MKIIFSDIDDTIRPEDGMISNQCIEAIKKVQEKGYEFVLVTGKNRAKAEEFSKSFGGCGYLISSNGGELFSTKTRKAIYSAKIPKTAIQKLYDIAKKYSLRFNLNIDADYRLTTRIVWFDGTEKLLPDNLDEVFDKHIVVGGQFIDISENLVNEIKREMFEVEGIILGNQGTTEGTYFIDFISEYANKGVAIKKLIQHLKADYNNTICLGNERNDIAMFSAVKRAIAVENATPMLKNIADEIIGSVYNDGVAHFLNSLV